MDQSNPPGHTPVKRRVDMASGMRVCQNDTCINLVTPSRNPGVTKLYCTTRCQRRQASRNAYKKDQGIDDKLHLEEGVEVLYRKMPSAATIAEARYKMHLMRCPKGADRFSEYGRCPGRNDPYAKAKLCLMQAVFLEDWNTLRRREKGIPYERELTTVTGTWQELPEGVAPPLPVALQFPDEEPVQ